MSDNKVFIDINGERIELTGEALIEHNNNREDYSVYLERKQKEAEDILLKRQELLDRLGITAEEAHLLLGGNQLGHNF